MLHRRDTTIRIHIHAETKSTIMTNENTSLEKYTSHTLFEMVAKGLRKGYVWEVSWRLNKLQHIDPPPVPLSLAALLSRSAGLLNRGSWGPIALCWVLVLSTASYLQLDWLQLTNILSHRVLSLFDVHLLPVSVASAPNSTRPQSRLYPDIFDRMHLFLHWRLGRRSICYINASVMVIVVGSRYSNTSSNPLRG